MIQGAAPVRLVIGFLLISVSVVLDTVVRLRLRSVGESRVFRRGGTLDYGQYLKRRKQSGWAGWPVYLIPPFLLSGFAFLVWALFRM